MGRGQPVCMRGVAFIAQHAYLHYCCTSGRTEIMSPSTSIAPLFTLHARFSVSSSAYPRSSESSLLIRRRSTTAQRPWMLSLVAARCCASVSEPASRRQAWLDGSHAWAVTAAAGLCAAAAAAAAAGLCASSHSKHVGARPTAARSVWCLSCSIRQHGNAGPAARAVASQGARCGSSSTSGSGCMRQLHAAAEQRGPTYWACPCVPCVREEVQQAFTFNSLGGWFDVQVAAVNGQAIVAGQWRHVHGWASKQMWSVGCAAAA